MAKRLIASLIAAAGALAAVPPGAGATLAYVKGPNSSKPQVWVARDDGTHQRKIARGNQPAISPDGAWVAWRDSADDTVRLRKVAGHNVRRVAKSLTVGGIAFSPDSTRLGVALRGRLVVHDIAARETDLVARGFINGFSFSPDSASLVYGTSGRNEAFDAPSDLYALPLGSDSKTRVTRDRKSLNPLWGPAGEIVFDRQTPRQGDAPRYNLFAIHPDGGALRRITALRIPPLLSGLVPRDMSADGRRLLAEFTGQDTSVGFAVNPASGRTRALSKNMETGFVATALSADGRTVLGQTGGADPANRHDVVTLPYAGGKPTVLVRRAAYPSWTR
jgi:Tol biopolymer transport system component